MCVCVFALSMRLLKSHHKNYLYFYFHISFMLTCVSYQWERFCLDLDNLFVIQDPYMNTFPSTRLETQSAKRINCAVKDTIRCKYLKETKEIETRRTRNIWSPCCHTPYPGKGTSISLTFHQTTTPPLPPQAISSAWLISCPCLSPCGKDDQLGCGGEPRRREPKNERNVNPKWKARENTSRMLNNNGQLESVRGLSTALRPARDAVVWNLHPCAVLEGGGPVGERALGEFSVSHVCVAFECVCDVRNIKPLNHRFFPITSKNPYLPGRMNIFCLRVGALAAKYHGWTWNHQWISPFVPFKTHC